MARPSKKQLSDRKRQDADVRRHARLEKAYRIAPFAALADFAYLRCEKCGQEQLDDPSDETVCVCCGHDIATTHPLHFELKRAAEAMLLAEAA